MRSSGYRGKRRRAHELVFSLLLNIWGDTRADKLDAVRTAAEVSPEALAAIAPSAVTL